MLRHALHAALCGLALVALPGLAAERYPSEQGTVLVREIASGLEHPWALAFLPDGQHLLVSERPGRLRRVSLDGQIRRADRWGAGRRSPGAGRPARCAVVA